MKNYLLFAIIAFLLSANICFAQKTEKCKVEVIGEVGMFSSYLDDEIGETLHNPPVAQGWTEVTVCGNKRVSGGVNLWGSLSTKKNPGSGTEGDVVGFVNVELNKKTNLRVEAGTFYIEGGAIYEIAVEVDRDLYEGKKFTASINNRTIYYRTSNSLGFPGGIVNKTSVTFDRSFYNEKINLSVTPAIGIDNNPFDLGTGKVVMMGFVATRLTIPINKKLDFFVDGTLSSPLAGDTTRGFRKSGGFGLAFKF